MKITVVSRSGRTICTLTLSDDATVEDLKASYAKTKRLHPSRQRWTLPSAPGEKPVAVKDGPLAPYQTKGEATLVVKDLGPQIGYSTVFILEYLGPAVIYPLMYFYRKELYSHMGFTVSGATGPVQDMACAYWVFHYVKRILETIFVHNFSHGTMPIFNLFRNCAYYWGFAAYVAYFINHPLYTAPSADRATVFFGLALLAQLGNFICHVILSRLRSGGSTGYQIPRGFLFNYITCANYTCEIYGWLLFNLATQSAAGVIFMLAGAGQMAEWALAKHKRLRNIFNGKDGKEKYPRRWVMLPPFF